MQLQLPTLATAALVALAATTGASADFVSRCRSPTVEGYTLSADCWKNNKDISHYTLDLNKCVANYGGNLACAKNGLGGSCGGCYLKDGFRELACKCSGGPDGPKYVSVDLNNCLTYDSKNLGC